MPDRDAPFPDLERQLWRGAISDQDAPQRALIEALDAGATYQTILQGLRKLWRVALPGHDIATRARTRWPASIDMALLALDFAPSDHHLDALSHLAACVSKGNRRRAALANAYLRLNSPDKARTALAQIDPHSPSAADDAQRRFELALADGDFDAARRDITWLETHNFKTDTAAMLLTLTYRQHGAAAFVTALEQTRDTDAQFHAQMFEICLQEGDYARASAALAHWQAASDANNPALNRAHCRFALARGDTQAAIAMMVARLDSERPWMWSSVDHLQWLRAGLADQSKPAALWDHTERALRLHPRHDGLAHIAGLVREAAEDWRALEPAVQSFPDTVERALLRARAALRMGLNGRALGIARRGRQTGDAPRVQLLRAGAFISAGRPGAAQAALQSARALTRDAVQRADITMLEVEIAIAQGKSTRASSALSALEDAFPDRMALWLTKARLAFRAGEFDAAARSLARFNALKAIQIGKIPAQDLRDRMIDDARNAAAGFTDAFKPDLPVSVTIAKMGLTRISASPALSACLMARAQTQGKLPFRPAPDANIPRQIAHYWQGPESPALARAKARWHSLHPKFQLRCFDAEKAVAWLSAHYDLSMVKRFTELTQPAARADLFRLCWIVQSGGIFADLDEYPRIPVTPWLTDAHAVFCLEHGFGTIANNFIAAEAGHPICKQALRFVCNALDQTSAPYPWWHSGPAQWTRAVIAYRFDGDHEGLRILTQTDYDRRVATNLPYPHKRSPEHWRG